MGGPEIVTILRGCTILRSSVTTCVLKSLYGLNNQPVQGFPETGADIEALAGELLTSVVHQSI